MISSQRGIDYHGRHISDTRQCAGKYIRAYARSLAER